MSYYNIEYLKVKGLALEIEELNKVLQEIEDEKGNLEYIGKALHQIVQLYIEAEKKP